MATSLLDLMLARQNPTAGLLSQLQGGPEPVPQPQVAPIPQPTPGTVQQPSGQIVPPAPPPLQPQQPPALPAPPAAPHPESAVGSQSNPILGRLFAGDPVPGLSARQNKQLRNQALLNAGLVILGASGEGASFGSALAQGVLAARQATAETAGQLLDEQAVQARLNERAAVFAADVPELDKWMQIRRISEKNGDTDGVKRATEVITELREADADKRGDIEQLQLPGGPMTVERMPDGSLRDPVTKRAITPEDLQERFQQELELSRTGSTRVNVDARPPLTKELDQFAVRQLEAASELADSSQQRLALADSVEDLLKDTPTGIGQEQLLPVRQLGAALGIPGLAEVAGRQETLRALSNQAALLARQNMPGAMSDNDIRFLQQQTARLSNTPEANQRIVELTRQVAQHQADRAVEIERFIQQSGTGVGLRQHLNQWEAERKRERDLLERAEGIL